MDIQGVAVAIPGRINFVAVRLSDGPGSTVMDQNNIIVMVAAEQLS